MSTTPFGSGLELSGNAGDRALVDFAARRQGVVTAAELHALGLTRHAIAGRVARGWLTRIHHGVFLVGAVRAEWAREAAALAACSPAVLSRRSATALFGVRPRDDGPVQVSIASSTARSHAGVEVHRAQRIAPSEITSRHGLAVTTIDRTLLDLACVLPTDELDRALNEALVRKLTTVPALIAYLERVPRRRGVGTLRSLLHDHTGITRSEAEAALTRLITRSGIPQPLRNVKVAGYEVDCYWPELGLVVEVDSSSFHGTPRAFNLDRDKEAAITAIGLRFVRITRFEIVRRPEATVARLARETARPPARLALPPLAPGGLAAAAPTAARPP